MKEIKMLNVKLNAINFEIFLLSLSKLGQFYNNFMIFSEQF